MNPAIPGPHRLKRDEEIIFNRRFTVATIDAEDSEVRRQMPDASRIPHVQSSAERCFARASFPRVFVTCISAALGLAMYRVLVFPLEAIAPVPPSRNDGCLLSSIISKTGGRGSRCSQVIPQIYEGTHSQYFCSLSTP